MRTVLLVLAAVAVLVVLAAVRTAYDDGPTPAEQRCQRLQVAANSVPEREDSVADEVAYVRLSERAEAACR